MRATPPPSSSNTGQIASPSVSQTATNSNYPNRQITRAGLSLTARTSHKAARHYHRGVIHLALLQPYCSWYRSTQLWSFFFIPFFLQSVPAQAAQMRDFSSDSKSLRVWRIWRKWPEVTVAVVTMISWSDRSRHISAALSWQRYYHTAKRNVKKKNLTKRLKLLWFGWIFDTKMMGI